jgi:hypothetical protein
VTDTADTRRWMALPDAETRTGDTAYSEAT